MGVGAKGESVGSGLVGADGSSLFQGDSNALAPSDPQSPHHQHVNVQQQIILSKDGVAVQIVRVVQVGGHQGNKIPLKIVNGHIHMEGSDDVDGTPDDTTQVPQESEPIQAEETDDPTVQDLTEAIREKLQSMDKNPQKPERETPKTEPRVEGDKLVIAEKTKTVKIPQHRPVTEGPPTPPQSMFRQLFPSRNRYTILKDEL